MVKITVTEVLMERFDFVLSGPARSSVAVGHDRGLSYEDRNCAFFSTVLLAAARSSAINALVINTANRAMTILFIKRNS